MEMQRDQEERQQIAIYPERSRIFKIFILSALFDIIIFFALSQLISDISSTLSSFQYPTAYAVFFMCLLYSIIIAALVLTLPSLCWFHFAIIRNWLSPQCVLSIDKEGITIYAQPVVKSIFFPWNSITRLHFVRLPFFQGTHLYLFPRDIDQLFSTRFQYVCWRWLAGYRRVQGVFLSAWLLAASNEELARQVQLVFKNELSQYRIQVSPTNYSVAVD